MLDPFTIRDGRFEMDEGRGIADGPRVIDPSAGVIRFKEETRTISLVTVRAVAVIWIERMMRVRVVRDWEMRPTLIHSVVLVPHKLPPDIDQILDQLERTPGVPI